MCSKWSHLLFEKQDPALTIEIIIVKILFRALVRAPNFVLSPKIKFWWPFLKVSFYHSIILNLFWITIATYEPGVQISDFFSAQSKFCLDFATPYVWSWAPGSAEKIVLFYSSILTVYSYVQSLSSD